VERSRDEYLSHHFEADAKFAQTVKRKVVWRSEQMAGDTALLLAETESSGSFKGKPIKLFGLETIVLRHVDGEWNIVHIHWSSRKR
jgi:ketosteroid isomerase-like protein